MPTIGPLELAIVLVIALVILGPKKLPDVGRSVGRGMREFKGALTGEASGSRRSADSDDFEDDGPRARPEAGGTREG